MKYLLLIPVLFFAACKGEENKTFTQVRILGNGDTVIIEGRFITDTIYAENPISFDTIAPPKFDSSKMYYKKYIYWQRKMNDELEKINRFQTPNITKALFRYQDSILKYETLLNKLKNKTK